ncbi:MAG: ABC transporter ATP-binding protein [Clostridiales Family XIII bacterium]|jgi:peptide/nickel transport system ATP-binding protein|nr:ABC transporter ATP-binding protein [Clostridiales Family XIII bacterium]
MERILTVNDLSVTYISKNKSTYAVCDASFVIDRGDSLGVVGESGSGKSTMAMALLRLLSEKSVDIDGQADFCGEDLFAMNKNELAKLRWKKLSAVFQKSMNSLSPVHRIGDQIEDIYRIHEPSATHRQTRERALKMLSLVNLNDRVYRLYPHELSGGMLQRVMIAVSLLHEPDLLILDEATTALDVVTQGQILEELRRMERELSTSRIIITHDMSVVAAGCNRVAVMYAGHMLETGPVERILRKPAHPYSRGLIAAFPPLKGDRVELKSIPGYLPDMTVRHEGCIFAPRCEDAQEKCRKESPERSNLGDGHTVSCHFAGGEK